MIFAIRLKFSWKFGNVLQVKFIETKYPSFDLIKVLSFEKAPTKKILFRYENLTWKQSDVIYPV